MDFKPILLQQLNILLQHENNLKNTFKVKAYKNVITNINKINTPILHFNDLKDVKGIGKSIETKIKEIFLTGQLQEANDIINDPYNQQLQFLQTIFGIGPKIAQKILELHPHIQNIFDVRKIIDKYPFTQAQLAGIQWYHDLLQRIPRKEIDIHNLLLNDYMHKYGFTYQICGSYRRGAKNSGDIDVILTYIDEKDVIQRFHTMIQHMTKDSYIQNVLSLGEHKCLAISKLNSNDDPMKYPARRIDFLLTNPKQFPFSILYFTGSQQLNIYMRNIALQKGYTLNEFRIEKFDGNQVDYTFNNENDIFNFLGMDYLLPENRNL